MRTEQKRSFSVSMTDEERSTVDKAAVASGRCRSGFIVHFAVRAAQETLAALAAPPGASCCLYGAEAAPMAAVTREAREAQDAEPLAAA